MNRLDIIQGLMREKGLKNYFEIGVKNGHIFFRIKSTFKIAVDPTFAFDATRRFGKAIINPYNLNNQYFEKTSDDFFAQDAKRVFAAKKVQLALIDGVREYQPALRDVENTLRYMNDNGVIILHDCNPQTTGSAERNDNRDTNDVWRTIIHLRSQCPNLNVFVLDCDQGLGIVTRKKPESTLHFTPNQIDALSYEDLNENREVWLNLKPASYFHEYFEINV